MSLFLLKLFYVIICYAGILILSPLLIGIVILLFFIFPKDLIETIYMFKDIFKELYSRPYRILKNSI